MTLSLSLCVSRNTWAHDHSRYYTRPDAPRIESARPRRTLDAMMLPPLLMNQGMRSIIPVSVPGGNWVRGPEDVYTYACDCSCAPECTS